MVLHEDYITEEYLTRVIASIKILKLFPRNELIEIRRSVNNWVWPDVLGPAPVEDWDSIPNYRWKGVSEDAAIKADFLKPVADALLILGVKHSDTLGK